MVDFDRVFMATFNDLFENFNQTFKSPQIYRKDIYTDRNDQDTEIHYIDGFVDKTVNRKTGETAYYIKGKLVSKPEYDKYYQEIEDAKEHALYIDGKIYKTTGSKLRKILEILK